MARRHSIIIAAAVLLALVILFATYSAAGASLERGRALYELRCAGCHSESVHARKKRVAVDFEDVRRWVSRWNETLALSWGEEELDDVAIHLNTAYYRFPCPPRVCKVVSQRAE